MNLALWLKSFREAKWLLLGGAVTLFIFHWIRVWITSQFRTRDLRKLMEYTPDFVDNLLVVPSKVFATPAGLIASSYDDPLVVLVVSIWAIARASDCVSGEIGRGTMELLLAQPVRRIEVLLTHAAVTVLGLAVLASSAWLGTAAGLATIELEDTVSARIFLPAALNLFALGLFLVGLTTLLSACDQYRSRTVGLAIGFYVFQTIVKLVSISVPGLGWLKYGTFLTAFEPQVLAHAFWPETLARSADQSWALLIDYNGLLICLSLAALILAAIIFCRRDLPAPL